MLENRSSQGHDPKAEQHPLAWRPAARAGLAVWFAIGVLCLLQVVGVWSTRGTAGIKALMIVGPSSQLPLTVLAVALSWAVVGSLLALVAFRPVTRLGVMAAASYTALFLLLVNVLRERTQYYDFHDYFGAAVSLHAGSPLGPRYLYPPFWAGLLAPLVPFGEDRVLALSWLLNLLSTVVMFALLSKALQRYGFSKPLATAVVFLFGVVNVAILRTLLYGQVNVHVANLILVSLVAYPEWRLCSALALAVAVHLKISPLVMIVPFVMVRDVRWVATFCAAVVALTLLTGAAYGWSPYLQVFDNLRHIERANDLAFRDNSIDSILRGTYSVTGLDLRGALAPAKIALLAAGLVVAVSHSRRRTFAGDGSARAFILNQTPSLLILMVTLSPLFWEHHPVFLALSYLVMLKVLSSPTEWLVFGFCYYLEFLCPTFDFFPWSYGRFVSALMLLGLAWTCRARPVSELFVQSNTWLNQRLALQSPRPETAL